KETVMRLKRVARKTAAMVHFLKEIGRLNTCQPRVEQVRLAGLVREVKVELRQHLPESPLECHVAGEVATVAADARLLTQAIVELLRGLLGRRPTGAHILELDGRAAGGAVELHGELSLATPGLRVTA